MWISRQMKIVPPTADADLGITTIAGGSAGVVTRGEVRSLPVYGPGGYIWMPESGGTVLVIKGGPGGEEQCVAGTRQQAAPEGMQPGEVCIQSPGGSIFLKRDGTIRLRGDVRLEGTLTVNGQPYKPCQCGEEGSE